ncbi:MAG TPA: MFS transporter [Thermoleophilia bacterium]|nr:MFS transporter [Thermoleophilia bacterium]
MRLKAADLILAARREARTFPRQFWLLTLGIFVYLIGVECAYPFETLYLNGRLGVSMTTIGLILGLTIFAGLPFQIVGGALTDKLGRRGIMALGVASCALLYAAFGIVHDLAQLVAFIAWEAAFGWPMFLTASNAMIADLTAFERRTEAFGITRVAVNGGMVFGPLLSGLVLTLDPSFRSSFLLGATICSVFLVMIAFVLKETKPAVAERVTRRRRSLGGYGVVLRDRRFVLFCLASLLPLYAFGQTWSIFPVALERAQGMAPESWSRLLALYAFSGALLQYPIVRLVRHRDSMLLLAGASALVGVGLGTAVFVPFGWATRVLFMGVSLGVMLLIPISTTVVSRFAPAELRGRYMGTWTLVWLAGYALGPLFGGLAMDTLGPQGAYLLVAASGLGGAALFPLLRPRHRPAEPTDDAGAEAAAEVAAEELPIR